MAFANEEHDFFKRLPEEKQNELIGMKKHFAEKAGIETVSRKLMLSPQSKKP